MYKATTVEHLERNKLINKWLKGTLGENSARKERKKTIWGEREKQIETQREDVEERNIKDINRIENKKERREEYMRERESRKNDIEV